MRSPPEKRPPGPDTTPTPAAEQAPPPRSTAISVSEPGDGS